MYTTTVEIFSWALSTYNICSSASILTKISQLISVHVWKLFLTVCDFNYLDVKSVSANIYDLHEYHGAFNYSLSKIASPTFDWLTVITLAQLEEPFKQTDLEALGRFPNLIALKFDCPHFDDCPNIYLDDRRIKHLGHLADEHCFPRLRTLFFDGYVNLTETCFAHLDKLPSLTLLSLRDRHRQERTLDITKPTTWTSVTV